ncbi:MAG: 30S ribosomal protein S17 [Candidatus Pacearchaeota archaeon]
MAEKNKNKDREATKNSGRSLRGRKFEGVVIRKFDKRVTIEFERVKFVRKYERYAKAKTKIHAYLPESMKGKINIGDYIEVMECRPLSKIMHHEVTRKIRGAEIKQGQKSKEDREEKDESN